VNEGDGLGRGNNNNRLPDCDGISPALKRFKHLLARVTTEVNHSLLVPGTETPQTQISEYISELEEGLSVVQTGLEVFGVCSFTECGRLSQSSCWLFAAL